MSAEVMRQRSSLYEIYGRLGGGKYGEVFKAKLKETDQRFAMKAMPLDNGHMRIDATCEIMALRALKNTRNVINLVDVVMSDTHVFLVLERMECDLSEWRPSAEEQLFGVAVQLFNALASIHAAGIMHRDLSPSNIMLDACGNIRIVDFGMCSFQKYPREHNVTASFYRAPEVFREQAYDARIDVWSAGCVLFELSTGDFMLRVKDKNFGEKFQEFFSNKEAIMQRVSNVFIRGIISQCVTLNRPTAKEIYLGIVKCG